MLVVCLYVIRSAEDFPKIPLAIPNQSHFGTFHGKRFAKKSTSVSHQGHSGVFHGKRFSKISFAPSALRLRIKVTLALFIAKKSLIITFAPCTIHSHLKHLMSQLIGAEQYLLEN